MMESCEYLFAKQLWQKLKEIVVGKIYCRVTKVDEIYVKIVTFDNFTYEAVIEHFSEKLVNGYTTDFCAYEIVNDFKKVITRRYFR